MPSTLEYHVRAHVAVIRLNRPEVLNALDRATLRRFVDAVQTAGADADVRVVIITGGPKAFCTGEDLREAPGLSREQFMSQINDFQALATAIRTIPQPVIAAIGGPAIGGGLEIAVNCDARIAADNALFGCPEVQWGLTITNGASVLLRRIIGDGWTRQLTLFGQRLDAAAAYRVGLVTQVVAADDLELSAMTLALTAAAYSPDALRLTKGLLNADPASWAATLDAETAAVTVGFGSDAVQQRLASFSAGRNGDRREPG